MTHELIAVFLLVCCYGNQWCCLKGLRLEINCGLTLWLLLYFSTHKLSSDTCEVILYHPYVLPYVCVTVITQYILSVHSTQ